MVSPLPDVLTRKYFIYILYHDAIEPEHMGYYHMHVWTPLHFLLHLALLLTVEGASTLILWNTSKTFAIEWSHLFAKIPMPWTPGFVSNNDLCNSLNSSIVALNNSLKTNLMYDDYGKDLRAIGMLNFKTSNYTVYFEAQNLTEKIYTGIEAAIFQTFFSSAPKSGDSTVSIKHKHYDTRLIDAKLGDISTTVKTAIVSFYIGAGLFLVLLAVLYCMSMGKKTREEWAATALRVVAGIGVTCTILANYVLPFSGYGFLRSVWLLPIVMLGYFLVIILDNVLLWYADKAVKAGGLKTYQTYQEMKGNAAREFSLDGSSEGERTAELLAGYHINVGDAERGDVHRSES